MKFFTYQIETWPMFSFVCSVYLNFCNKASRRYIQMRVNSSEQRAIILILTFLIIIGLINNKQSGATSPVGNDDGHYSSSPLYEEHAELITEIVEASVKKDANEEIKKYLRKTIVTLLKLVPEVGDAVDGIITVCSFLFYSIFFASFSQI